MATAKKNSDETDGEPSLSPVARLAAKRRRRFVGVLLGVLAGAAVGVVALVAAAAGGLPAKPVPNPGPLPPPPAPKPGPAKPGPKPGKPPKPDPYPGGGPDCVVAANCAADEVCVEGECVPRPPGEPGTDVECVEECTDGGGDPEECVKQCTPGEPEPCPEQKMLIGGRDPKILSVRTCEPGDGPALPECWRAVLSADENAAARDFIAEALEANEPIPMMEAAGYVHPGEPRTADTWRYYALAALRWLQLQRGVWFPGLQVDGEAQSSWRYWPGTRATANDPPDAVIIPKDAAVVECDFKSPTIGTLITDVQLDAEELLP